MIGEPQDDRLVDEAGFLEGVQHRHDVPVDKLVEVRVELYVFALRRLVVERRQQVVSIACGPLDCGFRQQIVGKIGRQLDREIGKIFVSEAGLSPDARIGPHIEEPATGPAGIAPVT